MSGTQLLLVRHGDTAGNHDSEPRLTGWTDLALSSRGRNQLRRLRARLLVGPTFAAIYSSSSRRAYETAEVIRPTGSGAVRPCAELREIHCGLLEGWTVSDVQKSFPSLWATHLRRADDDFRWPGGESYREFRARCLAAVHAIAECHRGDCVAVVTHAGVISQVVGCIHGARPAQWDLFRPGNASLTELSWREGVLTLLRFDDREHLAEPSTETPSAA
ncbi:MAG: histidine phosphatase family protein [Candidatus Binatia bacterium]